MYNAYNFTSIVGLPRESKILRAKHFRIGIIAAAKFAGHHPPEKGRHTKNKTHDNLHTVWDESSYLLIQVYHVKTTYNNTSLMNSSTMNKYSICNTVKSSVVGGSVWLLYTIITDKHFQTKPTHLILYIHGLKTVPFCIISVKNTKFNIHNLPNLLLTSNTQPPT